ncbi:MAG: hypothetical protein WBN23_08195, partial [Woeseia sp.]
AITLVLCCSVLACAPGSSSALAADEVIAGLQAARSPAAVTHMPEATRSSISKVVVIATRSAADEDVSGTYEKATDGLISGMASGSRLGRFSKQVGPVPIVIPIPILTIPGAIFGGLSGAAKREIQDFRDALTEELIETENPTLTDDGLALDVFWALRKLPGLDSSIVAAATPVPEDSDAELHLAFSGLEIDVQGRDAVITTSAEAKLLRHSDGAELYSTEIRYQDRDSLANWTANDNALWRDYVNFSRHYLGRALAADLFDRVELAHSLQVRKTDALKVNKKNAREFISASAQPTLAWELKLADDAADGGWRAPIDEADIYYDLEIFDAHEPVYIAEQVADPRHALTMELEPCKSYRWSVRPSFRNGSEMRYGDWLRLPPEDDSKKNGKKFRNKAEEEAARTAPTAKGLFGRQASLAPAYLQDFPLLTIACQKR